MSQINHTWANVFAGTFVQEQIPALLGPRRGLATAEVVHFWKTEKPRWTRPAFEQSGPPPKKQMMSRKKLLGVVHHVRIHHFRLFRGPRPKVAEGARGRFLVGFPWLRSRFCVFTGDHMLFPVANLPSGSCCRGNEYSLHTYSRRGPFKKITNTLIHEHQPDLRTPPKTHY